MEAVKVMKANLSAVLVAAGLAAYLRAASVPAAAQLVLASAAPHHPPTCTASTPMSKLAST